MDRILYTAAGGASRTLEGQAALSNNLANVDTAGFRAQLAAYRSAPVIAPGQTQPATRVLPVATTGSSLLTHGAIHTTGRLFDVAIQGDGWIAVQTPQGEAYTRAGSLQRNAAGELVTRAGFPVLSTRGQPIAIPENASVRISRHGGLNVIPQGGTASDIARTEQIKLVNPNPRTLARGADGLFRVVNPITGQAVAAPADPLVQLQDRALEDSNVNPATQMVGLIENARRFQLQMKVISDASANAQTANSILSINGS
ncbi:MAG: flagellar basal body rod protein FlgF [Candidimonas sp.]|nr:MAG: flagellar basal body rod protein FlgF [Candidimonas sp.]